MSTDFEARTTQTALTETLKAAVTVVSSKPGVPVLAGVKMEANRDGILISAVDDERTLTDRMDGFGHGSTVVSARTLLNFVKDLEKGCPITLHTTSGRFFLDGDGVTYELFEFPKSEFPSVFTPGGLPVAVLAPEQVLRLLDVVSCASRAKTLPILTGVHLVAEPGTLRAEATDRYRLGEYVLTGPEVTARAPMTFLVHQPTIKLVTKLFPRRDIRLSLTQDALTSLLTFTDGDRTLTTCLIDGKYPKVRALFPSTYQTRVTVQRLPFAKAFAQVAKAAERNTPVRLTIDADGDSVLFASGAGEDSKARKRVPAAAVGPALRTALAPALVDDALKAVGGHDVLVSFTAGTKPVVFSDTQRPEFRVLLMPVLVPGFTSQ